MTPSSTQLNLLVIRSPDIDRAVEFYQLLGLDFHKHSHGSGPEHYACDLSGQVFEIYPLSDKQAPTTWTRIGFSVSDVDSMVAKLSDIDTKIVSLPKDSEWGRRAVVKDFDGHTVELTQQMKTS